MKRHDFAASLVNETMLEIRNFQFVLYFKGSFIKKFLIERLVFDLCDCGVIFWYKTS